MPMTALGRLWRAALLALLLPALLAPSGWAWRLCFCEAMEWGLAAATESDSCCRKTVERDCCAPEEDPAPGETPREHSCGECRQFEAGNDDLAVSSAPELPVIAPPVMVEWSTPRLADFRSEPLNRRAACRAPPGVGANLPLRI